jgi:hypothetical protein
LFNKLDAWRLASDFQPLLSSLLLPILAALTAQLLGQRYRKVLFGGKDGTGFGTPEGLPLNYRFFHLNSFI